jgi:hypothetical protein
MDEISGQAGSHAFEPLELYQSSAKESWQPVNDANSF